MESKMAPNMAPNASPGKNKVGTRRVNNKPMLIALFVISAFVLMMLIVANDKANKAKNEVNIETPVIVSSNSSSFAQELVSYHNGIIPEEKPKLIEHDNIVSEPKAQSLDLDLPPNPSTSFQPYFTQKDVYIDPEKERIQMAKMQMFEQSLRAKTAINIVAPASSGTKNYSSSSGHLSRDEMLSKIASVRQKINTNNNSGDLTEEYKKRMEMLKNSSILNDLGAGLESSGDVFTSSMESKNSARSTSKWKIDSEIEIPSSPYELRSGFIIPGTLISGINSELPGEIVAQVSQNVYDTATGRYLLIPQGTRINGKYSSEVSFGQARIMIAWERIIFPDGKALDIGGMPGTDSAGYSGFNDKVNNHYLRIFGSAVLLSGISAGITYNQDKYSSDDKSARGALSEALGQQLGQTAMQMINKNMNVSPTLEIRPGYRFNIVVTKDISFSKPYQAFDY